MCDRIGYREGEEDYLQFFDYSTLEETLTQLRTMAMEATVEEPQEVAEPPQEFSVDQIPTGFGRHYYLEGLRRAQRVRKH